MSPGRTPSQEAAGAGGRLTTAFLLRFDPRKGSHGRHAEDGLPWAHTVFGNLKTWLRGAYHGVSPKHLQRYLNEFQFRFNKRWHEADLFAPVLQAAIAAEPFPYQALTAEPTG